MKKILLSFAFFLVVSGVLSKSWANEKVVGRLYFQKVMGLVHKNPSKGSSSLTTLQCGHAVKVIVDSSIRYPKGWTYVKVGDDRGYILNDYLTNKRPNCFQEKYPKFFNALNLDLTDMYYWGRLFDQYVIEESRIK